MATPNQIDSSKEILEAQAQVWNQIFSYINSMSLKCALKLGIPDIIHKHGKPITLSQLVHTLQIKKSKSDGLYRLMRMLVHSKLFGTVKISETGDGGEREAYTLTRASRLLLRDEPLSFAPFALVFTDPIMIDPFHHVTEWFEDGFPTPFFTKNGMNYWEFVGNKDEWNELFNEAMTTDGRFVGNMLVKECKHIFEGVKSVVDVAGGSGAVVKAVADAFPGLQCVVLELPHVVAAMEDSENLKFVSGDMFEFIPPADAVFLKLQICHWTKVSGLKIYDMDGHIKNGESSKYADVLD